jgi:alpha-tubulin suppressor-like RCC1 family protein
LAITSDGVVVAWGVGIPALYANYGQTNVPAGLSNVVAIAAGGDHSLALKADGSVVDVSGNPASGATVVLVPDAAHRQRADLFKRTVTDTAGHFTLTGVSPGEYRLFAWEDVETGAYQDPEFLQPFESKGESITIREGGHESRQLKLIPTESTPKSAEAK